MNNGGFPMKIFSRDGLFAVLRKRLLGMFAAVFAVLFLSATASAATLEILSESYTEKIISKGVKQYNYSLYTANGPLKYTVVAADLNMSHLGIKPLYSDRGIKNLVNTKILASQNGALAAINADFFAWNYSLAGTGSPLGAVIDNGKIISTPLNDFSANSLMEDHDGRISLGFLNHHTYVVSEKNGLTHDIACINKYDQMLSMCMYDSGWGESFESIYDGICKVVVESDGKVSAVTGEIGSIKIPQGGYVLTCLADRKAFGFVSENIEVGDSLSVNTVTNIDYSRLKSAVGGGTLLLANGKFTEITHGSSGRHPRSAVGTDSTGKILYLVAVDGRQSSSVGATLEELAQIMLRSGAENAMNLDGGGSTTLVSRDIETQTVTLANNPSDNYLRPVSSAIGVTQKVTPLTGKLSNIKLTTDQNAKNVFKNTSLNINVRGYDEYYNEVAIDKSNIDFIVEGAGGIFEGTDFIPYEAGMSKITAVIDGIKSTVYVKVLDKPSRLYFNSKQLDLSSSDVGWVILYGVDSGGYEAPINIRRLSQQQISCPDFADIGDYCLVKNGSGEGLLSVKIGTVTAHLGVSTLGKFSLNVPSGAVEDDEKMYYDTDKNSYRINFLGAGTPGTLLHRLVLGREIEMSNDEAEVTVFSGSTDGIPAERIKNSLVASDDFSQRYIGGNLFITLDGSDGSLGSGSKASQWLEMRKALENSEASNVFVVLTHSIDSISSADERSAFEAVLEEYAFNGKNIFVLSPGDESVCKPKNGVRYFLVGRNALDFVQNSGKNSGYLSVSLSDGDFSYCFRNSFLL